MDDLKNLAAAQNNIKFYEKNLWKDAAQSCLDDLDKVHEGLKSAELWSWRMIDSSTKIPNGIITGNLIDLGSYDECLRISSPVQGKHCLASINLSFGNPENVTAAPALTWSYCIPKSCAAKDLQVALSQFLADAHPNITVQDGDCHDGSAKILSTVDIFSISFFGLVLLLCVLSTAYDLSRWNRRKGGLLTAFSFYSNGRRLFSVSKTADTLAPLHGLRFLSIAWIILGHRFLWLALSSVMNLQDLAQASTSLEFQFVGGATLAVDTFFLMSGFLNAYNLLQLLDKTNKFPLVKYYVHRYIRTTPALAALILAQVSWYNLLGEGPMWEKTVSLNKQLCEDYWWPTLLYINNYYNPVTQCAGQSWYLAVDMQLYWIAPLVIIPCWRWPKLTKYYLGLLLASSTAAQFTIAYVDKIRMPFTKLQDYDEYVRVSQSVYTPTHARATPYIMGIMFGFYLVSLRKSGRKLVFRRIAVLMGWLTSTALCLTVIMGNYPLDQSESNHPYDRLESSFYIGFFRIAWCCGIIWTILACLYGYGGVVNSILSWETFIPFSRLSYCMYLCHIAIQQYQLGTIRNSGYFQDFDLLHQFFGDLIWAIIVSTVLSLTFESPLTLIEKHVMAILAKKPEKKGVENEGYVEDGGENTRV